MSQLDITSQAKRCVANTIFNLIIHIIIIIIIIILLFYCIW